MQPEQHNDHPRSPLQGSGTLLPEVMLQFPTNGRTISDLQCTFEITWQRYWRPGNSSEETRNSSDL